MCRSTYDEVVENGFRIESEQLGNRVFRPSKVYKTCEEAASDVERPVYDFVIVGTKAIPDAETHDDAVAAMIAPVVTEGVTAIVLIQNGFDIEGPFLRRYPSNAVISAVTIAAAVQKAPGVVLHNRWHRITFGYVPPGIFPAPNPQSTNLTSEEKADLAKYADSTRETNAKIDRLVDLLKAAGVPDAEQHDPFHMQLVRWHKAALNAAFNPTSALTGGCSNRQMTADPVLLEHCSGVMQEYFDAGEKIFGVSFPPEGMATIERIMESTKRNITDSKPSMWYDWFHNRPMELEVILHNPIKYAEKAGSPLKRSATMYGLLRMAYKNKLIALKNDEANKVDSKI